MIDLSRTLHQLADFLEAQGINMVDTIDGQCRWRPQAVEGGEV